MLEPQFLYIEEATFLTHDFFRNGNASGPRLDNVRPFHDVAIITTNGIQTIIANGNGISLNTKFDPKRKNTWKIPVNTPLPSGVKLVKDLRPGHDGHYMLAPAKSMPFAKFIGLLQELVMHCHKVS
ncbi:hypothetical protein F2P45_26450 [Massilia sp. CCM 8733]|uniref:Tse2 ADP-ribosyltransferase toxin domain-containing protein n=1 Tax=Massilia mucilaginosa TaxID=2609282 RepID=A0ABX0P130_9BURK|nr:hypothetical protein [Massilia mucilaginosa]NHZ92520.1 hypothetical protein [Massilia mucilaginosa]